MTIDSGAIAHGKLPDASHSSFGEVDKLELDVDLVGMLALSHACIRNAWQIALHCCQIVPDRDSVVHDSRRRQTSEDSTLVALRCIPAHTWLARRSAD
jgi:hypothetical protein